MKNSLDLVKALNDSFEEEYEAKVKAHQALKESEQLNETGEWDDSDDEMNAWKEDLRDKAEELARMIGGECKIVKGFDKYQGPFAVVATPKHGDIVVWYDPEDDTGLSLNAKIAHKRWIQGGVTQLADILNKDEISDDEIIAESEKAKIEAEAKDLENKIRETKISDIKPEDVKELKDLEDKLEDDTLTEESAPSKETSIDRIKRRLAEIKAKEDAEYEEITTTLEDLEEKEALTEEEDVKRIIFNKYRDEFDSIDDVWDLADTVNSLYQEGGWDAVNNWFLPAADEEYKELVKKLVVESEALTEDEVIEITKTEPELDYVITDVTVLVDSTDGDVQAPDIDAMLTMLGESFKEEYGDAIKINILSSSLLENGSFALVDISTPQILKEFEEKNIYDAAVGKNLVLEHDGDYYTFKVNSLNGTTRYSKRTTKPIETLREWIETEFLSEAKAEKEAEIAALKAKTEKETVESYVENRADLKQEVANIKMFIQLAKSLDNKDEMQDSIQQRMYALSSEMPATIEVANKEDKYELKFTSLDEIVEILFGKEWVKEATSDNEVIGLNESALPNISKFIYDLDKDCGNSWSAQHCTEDGKGNKIIIVSRNGMSDNTAEDIKKAVEEKYPRLKGEITQNSKSIWFYLQESSLNESYAQFNIGNIEVVYNPQTQECLYSIESADIHDKKINLSKVPSVETPYDTDTIIKDYIEKQYGPVPQEEPEAEETTEVPAETTEDLPLPTDAEVVEEADEVPTPEDMGIDTQSKEEAEPEAETGSAYFVKIRPGKQKAGIEDIRQQQKDGVVQQKSSYIVVSEVRLSEADFNEFTADFSQPRDFLTNVKPLDRKNYAFNVVKVTGEGAPYSVLVDPTGFNYARYLAINDEV